MIGKDRIKILLIEDNPADARLIQVLLTEVEGLKYKMCIEQSLTNGKKKLGKGKFDIVLTDLGLPDSHGLDTVNSLLELSLEVPIIVFTGLHDEKIGIDAVQSGAQDYLIKGEIDGNGLFRSIRYSIERNKMQGELKKYTEHLEDEVKQRTNELIQSEKMASLGQLVAGVAHEVNNPLAYITLNTNIIEERLTELQKLCIADRSQTLIKETNELLEIIIKGVDRIATITKALKRFAMPNSAERQPADINQGLKDTLLILENQFKDKIMVLEDYGDIPEIECNIGQINQVFMNLILNSIQVLEGLKTDEKFKGEIRIRTWFEGDSIYAEIKDNGPGVPDEIRSKIFDPFFTTKHDGTGLGLSLCYRIIEDHNGKIALNSKAGEGTTMVVSLPHTYEK
jgi:signal transduction histidine kinase